MPDLLDHATQTSTSAQQPLAELLRPQSFDEVIGQAHLLGPGKPLRAAFDAHTAHSMILWGPPCVGKTSLARLMAHVFDAELTRAQSGRRTLLFVDEVHRFNKAIKRHCPVRVKHG